MNAILHRLLPALSNNELFVESADKLEPFHIYFKMKDFYREQLSSADSAKMYVHHLKHEKCLSLLRQRNLEGANGLLLEIQKLDRNFPVLVQSGMDSLHHAMLAYVDYILLDNAEEALRKLKMAVTLAEQQCESYPYFCISIPTQWINILRLLIRSRDELRITNELVPLLKLCMFGVCESVAVQDAYKTLRYKEHVLVVSDVFDNVIFNLDKSFGFAYTVQLLNQIVRQVLLEADELPCYTPGTLHVLRLLQLADEGRVDTVAECLWFEQSLLVDVPDSLKRILVYVVKNMLLVEADDSATVIPGF